MIPLFNFTNTGLPRTDFKNVEGFKTSIFFFFIIKFFKIEKTQLNHKAIEG